MSVSGIAEGRFVLTTRHVLMRWICRDRWLLAMKFGEVDSTQLVALSAQVARQGAARSLPAAGRARRVWLRRPAVMRSITYVARFGYSTESLGHERKSAIGPGADILAMGHTDSCEENRKSATSDGSSLWPQ